ncbi:MAG: hypothetical protein V4532_10930 [Pseudomonadota bacterium]
MLVLNKRRGWLVWLVGGALALAVAGGVVYVQRAQSLPTSGPIPNPVVAIEWAPASNGALAASGAGSLSMNAQDPVRPADIAAQDWKQLIEVLRDHPQREQELKRVVAYMRFKNDMDRWTALKDQPNVAERHAAGQRVLDALPAHFANQEVTGAEALMLQAAIYADLVPDEAQRKPMLESARQALLKVQAQDTVMQEKMSQDEALTQDYKHREAEIMARYTAKQIDSPQLEKELNAARVAVFK